MRGFYFYLILAILIGFAIYYGGTFLTRKSFESYKRKIDKNGLLVKAKVFYKRQFKGHEIYYNYDYNTKSYEASEQNGDYYEILKIGDIIDIKIDTTNPKNSYIYLPGVKTNNY